MGDETSVFVSYRRDDSKHAAGRLGERLGERFKLFMDIDSIRPGTDFTAVVRDAVDRADVVLAVIGKGWLSASSQTGARRLDEAHDWVSLEVGTALKHGTPVIPVLVDGARMPDRADLPESLTDLASRQAISLDHESFAADCSRLIETIEGLVGSQGAPDVDLWADPDYPAARSALLQGKWARRPRGWSGCSGGTRGTRRCRTSWPRHNAGRTSPSSTSGPGTPPPRGAGVSRSRRSRRSRRCGPRRTSPNGWPRRAGSSRCAASSRTCAPSRSSATGPRSSRPTPS